MSFALSGSFPPDRSFSPIEDFSIVLNPKVYEKTDKSVIVDLFQNSKPIDIPLSTNEKTHKYEMILERNHPDDSIKEGIVIESDEKTWSYNSDDGISSIASEDDLEITMNIKTVKMNFNESIRLEKHNEEMQKNRYEELVKKFNDINNELSDRFDAHNDYITIDTPYEEKFFKDLKTENNLLLSLPVFSDNDDEIFDTPQTVTILPKSFKEQCVFTLYENKESPEGAYVSKKEEDQFFKDIGLI